VFTSRLLDMTQTKLALPPVVATTSDFDFLHGPFDVTSRRLRDALDLDSGWVESSATSIATHHFAGAISIDEMWFPDDGTYGLSVRLFDPAEHAWTAYWLTSDDGVLPSPLTGKWADGGCLLTGERAYAGRPVLARHRWSDVTETSAHWEQSYSVDGGISWQPNWTMRFVRRATSPDHASGPRVTSDFDFLPGTWRVDHRRRPEPLVDGSAWVEFDSVHCGRTYFNGAVSVDEISLPEGRRGFTMRRYDAATKEWSIYWVNSRIGRLDVPVRGRFEDGVGTFYATEEMAGRPVRVRFVWSDITATTARWRQAFSFDDGVTWDENWEMQFTRAADA
jgi:hypothetical protein